MKNWKVKIEHNNKTSTVTIKAGTFSDAFIAVAAKYSGCEIKSITEVRKK
jgi:hypothetical protein